MSKRIWVAWLHHRRNLELSQSFRAYLHQLLWEGPSLLRYPLLTIRTLFLLLRERPDIVFAQNPSVVLAFLLARCRGVMKFRLVVDAHNAGLEPMEGRSRLLNGLARAVIRKSDLTLVTNEALVSVVTGNGGRGFVLPDSIPRFQDVSPAVRKLEGENNILFVCTFASDEPYMEVIRAARGFGQDTIFHVTGNYHKAGLQPEDVPANVRLMGFVSEEAYVSILFSADVILDLTTRENCLVCGAYESVAAGKPLIVSDTKALRAYFYKGVLYTRNSAEHIAENTRKALEQKETLTEQIKELKHELVESWQQTHQACEALIASLHQETD